MKTGAENTTAWQSLNRSGGSLFFLIALFAISAGLHFMARGRIDLVELDDRAEGEARLIEFVHGHLWIPPLYFAFLVAVWFRLSVGNAGKIAILAALLLLSAPVFFYDRACLHIGGKLLSVPIGNAKVIGPSTFQGRYPQGTSSWFLSPFATTINPTLRDPERG